MLGLCLLLVSMPGIAEGQEEGRAWVLTNVSEGPGVSSAPAIAIDANGAIHVAWHDNSTGNEEVFYRRRDPIEGWGARVNLSSNELDSLDPAVAVTPDGVVHVVWHDYTEGNYEVFYRRGVEGTFDATVNVSKTTGSSDGVAIAGTEDGRAHVVWYDNTPGASDIYVATIAEGKPEAEARNLSGTAADSLAPTIAGGPGGPWVCWMEREGDDYRLELRSTAAGAATKPLDLRGALPHLGNARDGVSDGAWAPIVYVRTDGATGGVCLAAVGLPEGNVRETRVVGAGETAGTIPRLASGGDEVTAVWASRRAGVSTLRKATWNAANGTPSAEDLLAVRGSWRRVDAARDGEGRLHVVFNEFIEGNEEVFYGRAP